MRLSAFLTDATLSEGQESARRRSLVGSPLFQLSAIILAGGSANYAFVTLSPLQETMRVASSLSDTQIAMLQGPALYLPAMLVALPLGFLIDRFSRARLLAVFTALELVGTVLTALAPSFPWVLLARVLIGSMQTANAMNASALVAEWVAPGRRGSTLMILGIGQMACVSAAFALGGHLIALLGNWRWAMMGLAVPLAPVFLMALWVREPERECAPRPKLEWGTAVMRLWCYRATLMPLSVGQVSLLLGYTSSLVWASPILARRFHLPPERIGSIMGTVLLVSGVLGPLFGGILADRCQRTGGPRRTVTLLVVLALALAATSFYGVMPSVSLMSLLLTALCLIGGMKGIICTALTSVVIPEELLGLSFGAINAIAAVFTSISPVVVSLLANRIDGAAGIGQALAVVCIVTSLAGTAIFVRGRRYFPGLVSN